jgi:hypothetical protein
MIVKVADRKEAKNLAGKVLRLIQDRLNDAEFGKNSPTRQDNSPQARIADSFTPRQRQSDLNEWTRLHVIGAFCPMFPAALPSLRSPAHADAPGMSANRDDPATVFASRKFARVHCSQVARSGRDRLPSQRLHSSELRALRRGCQEQASTTKGSASAISEFYAGAQQLPQKSLA